VTPVLAAGLVAVATWLLAPSSNDAARRLGLVLPSGVARRRPLARAATGAAAWRTRRRLQQRRDAEAVTLCAAFAAELRVGLPPAAALASAATELPVLGPRLSRAARAVGRGAHLSDELELAAADEACARLSAVAAVCAAGEATGAGVADVLDRIGRGLASDDDATAELDALSAGPRATALVLAGLPALAVASANAIGLHPLRILLHTLLGVALVVAAAVLELAGLLWVRRITAVALGR
jgi:tight adherence protein B